MRLHELRRWRGAFAPRPKREVEPRAATAKHDAAAVVDSADGLPALHAQPAPRLLGLGRRRQHRRPHARSRQRRRPREGGLGARAAAKHGAAPGRKRLHGRLAARRAPTIRELAATRVAQDGARAERQAAASARVAAQRRRAPSEGEGDAAELEDGAAARELVGRSLLSLELELGLLSKQLLVVELVDLLDVWRRAVMPQEEH